MLPENEMIRNSLQQMPNILEIQVISILLDLFIFGLNPILDPFWGQPYLTRFCTKGAQPGLIEPENRVKLIWLA